VLFMPMPDKPEEHAAVDRVYGALIEHALAAGGTCTGEHGIGMGKKAKLLQEYGGEVVGLMHRSSRRSTRTGFSTPARSKTRS
jgi:D-lactate dehydrogenase (cytochrome)